MSTTKPDDADASARTTDANLFARAKKRMANIAESEPERNDAWFKPTVIALSAVIAISLLLALYFFLTDRA
jgi:hypothetical protein